MLGKVDKVIDQEGDGQARERRADDCAGGVGA